MAMVSVSTGGGVKTGQAPRCLSLTCKAGSMGPPPDPPHGHTAAMDRRVDLACLDGKSARRGMASCQITAISPSGTV